MSINSLNLNIQRIQKEIADLQKKISDEKKKEARAVAKINQIQRSITKSTSASSLTNKLRQIERLNDDIARSSKKQAELSKKLASKNFDLNRYQQQLTKELDRERKKQEELQKRRERELLEYQRTLTQELIDHRRLIQESTARSITVSSINTQQDQIYDVFISHASEDKDDFVRPLAEELERIGVKVWYDEFTLKIGDSLRRSIDKGLAQSRFGVVVLSSAFFNKNWTQYELDGLVAREMQGNKVILPIWHKVTIDEVRKYSPSLADKVAINSSMYSIQEIARQLAEVL